MSDFYPLPHFSVVDKVVSGWKAPRSPFDGVTFPPGFRVLSEQPETIYDSIDQSVCDIQAVPFGPIGSYVVHIVLVIFRDAVSVYAFGAFPASSFLPLDLTSAAKF